MDLKVGNKLRILEDGWWRVSDGRDVLTTDLLMVTQVDSTHCRMDVGRDGETIGSLNVQWCYTEEDFEVFIEPQINTPLLRSPTFDNEWA